MAAIAKNYRVFDDAGIIASVTCGIGRDHDWKKYPVDPTTGIIGIPEWNTYKELPNTHPDISVRPKPRAFELEISHADGDDPWVVVSQRDSDNQYKRELPGFSVKELSTYHFPLCSVALVPRNGKLRKAERGCGEQAIFTTPKSQSGQRGTNRVDAWVFRKDGFIGLFQVLVTTFDDGETFRLVGNWRGKWNIHRLPAPRAYVPQYSPVGKRRQEQTAVFNDPHVRKLLDQVIFVPEGSYTGFDSRIEVLENYKVLNYIEDHLANFPVWETKTPEGEPIRNFSIRPDVEGIKLVGNRGILQFFTHGLAGCGMGIVTGADGVERQVRYHCFDKTSTLRDEQGLIQILDGDVVEWDEEIEMGFDQQKNPYPNLIIGARVQMVNVARRRALPVIDGPASAAA